MYRVLQVAQVGFHRWLHKPFSDHAIEDQCLIGVIRNGHPFDWVWHICEVAFRVNFSGQFPLAMLLEPTG